MIRIKLLFIFSLFIIGLTIHAQNITISGSVINAETGETIEFANLGVENTYLGTASDIKGEFELRISESLKDRKITISAVGYKPKDFIISELLEVENGIVQLIPMKYGLSEVSVAAESKIGYGIIRTANHLIEENYRSNPYTYNCYLHSELQDGNQKTNSECTFLLADKKGYGERSFTEAFQSRNYKITQSNSANSSGLIKDGLTLIDQLLLFDIVRTPGNVLSVESINEFDIDVEGEEMLYNELVWKINFICQEPNIQNGGDPELKSYKGSVWISKNTHAVIKSVIKCERNGLFRHGNNFANPAPFQGVLTYSIETFYTVNNNKYLLDYIQYKQSYNSKQWDVYLKVMDVLDFDETILNRQYFNNVAVNYTFWSSFKRPQK